MANSDGLRRLVIVESATRTRKIRSYLGDDYIVEALMGHIRDLFHGVADVPARYKKEPWACLDVNVDNGFAPLCVVNADKKKKVADLKAKLKEVDELYFTTDPDYEGEAIAWHLLEVLKPKVPMRRMIFHETIKQVILEAAANIRELGQNLVDVQEGRRTLDRLYGYEVFPVLWGKVMPRLLTGCVQSVAMRVITERKREYMAFISVEYWDIVATLDAGLASADVNQSKDFVAALASAGSQCVAQGRDFDDYDQLKESGDIQAVDKQLTEALAADLVDSELKIASMEEKPYTRRPYPLFITSTLQQEVGRKLHYTPERTMCVAQRLYENSHITYIRTDFMTLSKTGIDAAHKQTLKLYGSGCVADVPRQYLRKVENSQEVHKVIRPAGETFATPGQLTGSLGAEELKLCKLIWQYTVASWMANAYGTSMKVTIVGVTDARAVELIPTGHTIRLPSSPKTYVEISAFSDGRKVTDNIEKRLPQLAEDQDLTATDFSADSHSINPPAYFTETGLVKKMEGLGIGRPSTYASIIRTIQDHGCAYSRGNTLIPSWVAFTMVGLMEKAFFDLVNYDFTSELEDELDSTAMGNKDRATWPTDLHFGNEKGHRHKGADAIATHGGLKNIIDVNLESIDARKVNSLHLFDDAKGNPIVARIGRYGSYLECTRPGVGENSTDEVQHANIPEIMAPDELNLVVAEKLLTILQGSHELGINPVNGRMIVARDGRYGPYVIELVIDGERESVVAKAEEIIAIEYTEEDVQRATEGKRKKNWEIRTAAKQKKKCTAEIVEETLKPRTTSLFSSVEPPTITLEEALKPMSLPREIGVDPVGNEVIAVQNGRYGPYLKKSADSRSPANEEQIFAVTLDEARRIYTELKRHGRAVAKPPLKQLGDSDISGCPMSMKDDRSGPYVTDGVTNASLCKGDMPEILTGAHAYELLSKHRAKEAADGGTKKAVKESTRKTAKKAIRKTSGKITKKTVKRTVKRVVRTARKGKQHIDR